MEVGRDPRSSEGPPSSWPTSHRAAPARLGGHTGHTGGQLDVLHQVRGLGITTLAALHDLNLAAAWCDHIYVMNEGRVVASGPPEKALDAELIGAVFGVHVVTFRHPISGRHQLLFDRLTADAPTPVMSASGEESA